MRKPRSSLALPVLALSLIYACAPQEPAATPLEAPAPAEPAPLAATPPAAAPAPAPAPELTPAQLVQTYHGCWAALTAKDFAKVTPCYADNAVSEMVDSGTPAATGKDIVEKHAKPFTTAFPDLAAEPQLTLANGNKVIGVWLVRGTHQGPLPGPTGEISPTNKRVGYLVAQSMEAQGGKAVKELTYSDSRTFLGQLGLVPGPVRKVMEQGAAEKPVVIASGAPTEAANLELYKKYVDSFNKHDAKEVEPLLADDFVYSDQSAPADLVGKKEASRGIKELWKGFSDVRVDPSTVWAAGDYVVSQGTFSGTNDGAVPSMKLWKKTGKKVSVSALDITKIQNGKIKQQWVFTNSLALANQLGMTPPVKENKPAAPTAKAAPATTPAATTGKPPALATGTLGTAPVKPATAGGPAGTPHAMAPAGKPAPAAPEGKPPAKPAEPNKPAAPAKPAETTAKAPPPPAPAKK